MNSFNVYDRNGRYLDTVSHVSEDAGEVRHGLINHDGFNPSITVIRTPVERVQIHARQAGAIGITYKMNVPIPARGWTEETARDWLYHNGYEMISYLHFMNR